MTKRLLGFYDLRCAPVSFDFAFYLAALIGHAEKNGYTKITLCIIAPFYRKTNDIELSYGEGYEDRKIRSVFLPLIGLLPIIDDVIISKSGLIPQSADSFPVGYNPTDPRLAAGSSVSLMPCTPAYLAKAFTSSGHPRVFRGSPQGRRWINSRYSENDKLLTISPRTASHNSGRNCSLSMFYDTYSRCRALWPTWDIVVVPDQDDVLGAYQARKYPWELCPEASVDLELRFALYERAVVNIAWNGGLTALLMLSDASYAIFGIWNEANAVAGRAVFDRKGPSFGAQLPWAVPGQQMLDWTHSPDVTAEYMVDVVASLVPEPAS